MFELVPLLAEDFVNKSMRIAVYLKTDEENVHYEIHLLFDASHLKQDLFESV